MVLNFEHNLSQSTYLLFIFTYDPQNQTKYSILLKKMLFLVSSLEKTGIAYYLGLCGILYHVEHALELLSYQNV
jgi:hypothetical protein